MAVVLPGAASADIITFSTGTPGVYSGPTVEGDYSYGVFSGGLFLDGTNGDPGAEMQGLIASNGGALQLVRDDIVGGLFTFDQASVEQWNFGAVPVVIEGYLGGALQGTDSLMTSSTSLVHTTLASVNLNGVVIDELRVFLDASSAGPGGWEGIDNIVLTSVPEPTSIVLVAAGLIVLNLRERSRRRG
jgi:hypothetical protein